jgi:V-type H+-transporting ATPase subunit a
VKDAHRHLGEDLGLVVHLYDHHPEPPTHFKLNKYTRVFQDLVDTYGVARYREINPAVFTAVTFPFLFGVMYGDIGHGTCLLLAGLYLILTENQREGKKMDELTSGLHGGRYMLLMMGVFAVYCGLVYNDMFALSLNAMPGGTQWEYICPCKGETDVFQKFPNGFNCHSDTSPLPKGPNDSYRCSVACCLTDPKKEGVIPKDSVSRAISSTTPEMGVMGGFAEGNVYPFGLDPMWKGTANEGMYFNSFKMKISVILGISQMVFGICLKGVNAVFVMMNTNDKHAKKHAWYDFMHEFVPQMLFACCLFVYMMWMIVYKWTINWQDRVDICRHL